MDTNNSVAIVGGGVGVVYKEDIKSILKENLRIRPCLKSLTGSQTQTTLEKVLALRPVEPGAACSGFCLLPPPSSPDTLCILTCPHPFPHFSLLVVMPFSPALICLALSPTPFTALKTPHSTLHAGCLLHSGRFLPLPCFCSTGKTIYDSCDALLLSACLLRTRLGNPQRRALSLTLKSQHLDRQGTQQALHEH